MGTASNDPICNSRHSAGSSRISLRAFADWKARPFRSLSVATSEFDATEPPGTLAAVPEQAVQLKYPSLTRQILAPSAPVRLRRQSAIRTRAEARSGPSARICERVLAIFEEIRA